MPYEKDGSIFHNGTGFCLGGKSANPKQLHFLKTVLSENDYRYFAYGGAIRGGKSYVVLFILHQLCLKYPKSKWCIVRSDMPVLKSTTIPSFNKLVQTDLYGKWNLSSHTFTYKNGSQLIFKSENIQQDPDLNSFLGLEVNGFFLEQAEELSSKMWQKALERTGSWYVDPMPKALILTTFNPTQNWVKEMFFEPHKNGTLEAPYYFESALPKDNPFVTKDQWSAWGMMHDRYKLQFIEGDWSDFNDTNGLWAFAFDRKKHIATPKSDNNQMLYLSFDFNKNPICCSVIQWDGTTIKVVETIKLANSDIYAMCMYIKTKYKGFMYMVTGDASGKSTSAMVQDNLNYYKIIVKELGLTFAQVKVPSVNPKLEDNQVLVNSLLSNYPVEIHETDAKALIYDLQNVKMLPDGTIKKVDRTDPTQQADALDTFRYFCNTFMSWFLKFSK